MVINRKKLWGGLVHYLWLAQSTYLNFLSLQERYNFQVITEKVFSVPTKNFNTKLYCEWRREGEKTQQQQQKKKLPRHWDKHFYTYRHSGDVIMAQWPQGGRDGKWQRDGARGNHGQAIIICLYLFFYPLSLVDKANGIASLCHSKSHFCPPRPCLCWQSIRTRVRKRGGKAPTEDFSTWLFVNFCVLVKWRGSA